MPGRIAPIAFLLAAVAAFATHGCGKSRQDEHAEQIAARVRTEFLHAWNNYERYAWGHDALRPLGKIALWYGHADMQTGKRTKTIYGALDAFFPGLLAL